MLVVISMLDGSPQVPTRHPALPPQTTLAGVPVASARHNVSALVPVQVIPVGSNVPEMVIFEYVPPVRLARKAFHDVHCELVGP
jgi:hypothetical protein